MTTSKQTTVSAPFSGSEYIESLNDGREVYLDGERVVDLASHPGFQNSIRSIARLYDALQDPAQRDILTCPTDTGSGGCTHRYFRVSRSREDLKGAQLAIAAWSRLSYGWMGRSPDYKAAFTNTLGANPEFYGPYAQNARRWYRFAQERVPFFSHAIVNPPIDRHKPAHEVKDVFIRAERETDQGVIVSGAKVVATSAATTQYMFIGQTPIASIEDLDMALAFIVPMSARGVKLICRTSYESNAYRNGTPFDFPLSSRFDENDAILILDKVLIPWEDILIYRDPKRIRSFYSDSGFLNGFLFQGCTRFAVKLDFMAGLLARALRCMGAEQARSNQVLLGEVIAWSHLFWSLSNEMAANPDSWIGDAVLPERRAALAYNVFAPEAAARVREIVLRTVSSGLIYLPSSAQDFKNPAIEPYLRQYVRGSNGIDHVERVKVMKLLWDAVGTEFAGRHDLYERNYAGSWENTRVQVQVDADRSGKAREMDNLVSQCLADYDLNGWTTSTWSSADLHCPAP